MFCPYRVIEELRAEVYCIKAPESPRKSPRKGVTVDTRTYTDILGVQELEGAAAQFSRQRALPLARNDTIRPISEIEAESHENYYRFMDKVDIESIAPIKQDWIYNVCGMANVDSYSIPKVCFRLQIEWPSVRHVYYLKMCIYLSILLLFMRVLFWGGGLGGSGPCGRNGG